MSMIREATDRRESRILTATIEQHESRAERLLGVIAELREERDTLRRQLLTQSNAVQNLRRMVDQLSRYVDELKRGGS